MYGSRAFSGHSFTRVVPTSLGLDDLIMACPVCNGTGEVLELEPCFKRSKTASCKACDGHGKRLNEQGRALKGLFMQIKHLH